MHQKILERLDRQLHNFFTDIDLDCIESKVDEAYERCCLSFKACNNKYLNPDGMPRFSINHSGCWSIFLYYLSNSLKNLRGGG